MYYPFFIEDGLINLSENIQNKCWAFVLFFYFVVTYQTLDIIFQQAFRIITQVRIYEMDDLLYLILCLMLLFAHPTQTTLLNDIFWASKSTFHTGMYPNLTIIFTLVFVISVSLSFIFHPIRYFININYLFRCHWNSISCDTQLRW